MNIVCLLGSPRRKGNSATIAGKFIDTATGLGANCQTFQLNKLTYRGCQACYGCKTREERCILKDDLTDVLEAVAKADVLVMATPVYYGDISSQLKAFVDRSFSFLVPDFINSPNPSRLSPGKKLVIITSQGQPDESLFTDIYPRYENFFQWYGYQDNHLIRACGVSAPGEVEKHEEIMRQASETAIKIMGLSGSSSV